MRPFFCGGRSIGAGSLRRICFFGKHKNVVWIRVKESYHQRYNQPELDRNWQQYRENDQELMCEG